MPYCNFTRISGGVRCSQCHCELRTSIAPERLKRTCYGRELTAAGRLLIGVSPGDRLAAAAQVTGAAAVWAAIRGGSCNGCCHRQQWLNRQWTRLVWRFCSVPHEDAASASKRRAE